MASQLHKLLLGASGIYIAYLSMSYLSEELYLAHYPATPRPSCRHGLPSLPSSSPTPRSSSGSAASCAPWPDGSLGWRRGKGRTR
jgi:hypothetical protein